MTMFDLETLEKLETALRALSRKAGSKRPKPCKVRRI